MANINRLEVIDETGRAYTNYSARDVELSYQDDGKTLKVFCKGAVTDDVARTFHGKLGEAVEMLNDINKALGSIDRNEHLGKIRKDTSRFLLEIGRHDHA